MFSSEQTHNFDYFICYHLESGWHVTRPNQGISLGRGKSLGTRLLYLEALFLCVFRLIVAETGDRFLFQKGYELFCFCVFILIFVYGQWKQR